MTTDPDATIHGVDFTCAPRAAKPIVVASGKLGRDGLRIDRLEAIADFAGFEAWLALPGPWVAAFDFPFGLARELVRSWGWPSRAAGGRSAWSQVADELDALPRRAYVERLRAFCDARPPGAKFAHRAVDRPAGSSPSMKWVNPPVAQMLHAGVPRLRDAGVHLPRLHDGDRSRVALEGYPGLAARAVLGRASYKRDGAARGDPARRARRAALVDQHATGAQPRGGEGGVDAAIGGRG
ncbi:MAG: DUF429 domain-containing protein, partial [Burkholderiaceae bacterium]|nr:DUF429 domain-containing protein [Burkholderiaceae bacterium]